MGKRVFLHIGPHKTGTTSIQATLRFNRDYLESCGICYLPVGLGPTPERMHGQHNLAWALCGNYRHRPDGPSWDDALQHIAHAPFDTFLISSEAFSTFDLGMTRRVADYLAEHQVTVVYMLRNHLDMLNSMFGQKSVKWNTDMAEDWFRRRFRNLGGLSFLHARKIAPWLETFGREALRLPVFETEAPDLAGGVLRLTGRAFDPARVAPRRMNPARRRAQIVANVAICRALSGRIDPAFYDLELAPELTRCADRLPLPQERPFYVPANIAEALEGPIREDVAHLRALGAVLPSESYDRTTASVSGRIEALSPDVGAVLAVMLLNMRRMSLAARAAALPAQGIEKIGSRLQSKIDVIDAALDALGGT